MAAAARPLSYTDDEIRSYLISGWGIVPDSPASWDAKSGTWSVEIYDVADHVWKLEVAARDAERDGRFEALKAAIRKISRHGLGRKSILTG
jgi:hypothetical protein